MSFLQPKIIPRGYIATTGNKTTPRKRLNSVSEISLKPSLPNLPRPYVKRAIIDPFEQHYVTPFIHMFDEEEAEEAEKNEQNKLIADEQKSKLKQIAEAAASSEIGRRIVYGARRTFEHPVQSLYDLVTLPADVIHALEGKINTDNEIGRVLLQAEEEERNAVDQNEKDKAIRQTLDDISTFVKKTGGLPTWGVRKLKKLKQKYFADDDVDVSSDLQAWNQEEKDQLVREPTQQLQGFLTSKYQQKGYMERMEATKSLQSLLKSRKVEKEYEQQQETAKKLLDSLHEALLRTQEAEKEYESKRGLKRLSPHDDGEVSSQPVLKKSHLAETNLAEPNLEENKKDIRDFLHQDDVPENVSPQMHTKLLLYLANKKGYKPFFVYKDKYNSASDGVYAYNPETKALVVYPGILNFYDYQRKRWTALPDLNEGFFYL